MPEMNPMMTFTVYRSFWVVVDNIALLNEAGFARTFVSGGHEITSNRIKNRTENGIPNMVMF